ncbi:CYCLIN-DEPENDENT KINASE [Salix koriyanagi]|uniref:CYCLIN-DEPENDENT KINASE n=1 Tax=Salix koriyanagi TaxID=2511006 RepID=A0A9Q0QLZ3_9ROSI|nr:CYCLIN-DEPENDENT KINASE [Salix koriyanagi]
MWEKEIWLALEDPLGRDTLAGLPKPEQPTRKYNGARAGNGEERKLSDTGRVRFVEFGGEEVVDGWPKWLTDNVPREVLGGLIPKSAENYDKLAKVGEGTYSNVYKARDKETGKIVALKKVRFDASEPESVKFMAREIVILQKLDHPNVVKLEELLSYLLGATDYGTGIDLWSAGCLLAEMFAGRPIMPGRTEVEQLHRIFKLCGTPPEDYWKKLRLSTTFRRPRTYKPGLFEAFSEFPESALGLLTTLLALDPASRGSASSALQNEFFHTSPLACDLSGLPVIQKDEDELTQADEQRKRRNAIMKRRSQTYREQKKKDLAAEEPKEDPAQPKEEPELTSESINQSHEPGSSSSSSNSSGKNPTHLFEIPSNLLQSRIAASKKKMSPNTQGHANAPKNIKNLPPLPTSRTGSTKYDKDMYRLNRVHRSASTREVIKFDQGKQLEVLYAVG